MKQLKQLGLTLSFLMAFALSFTYAQRPHGGERPPHPPMERIVEHLQEVVELTPAQVEALEEIVATQKADFEALKEETFESRAAKRDAFKAVHENLKASTEGVLTTEQLTQLENFQSERKENGDFRGKRPPHHFPPIEKMVEHLGEVVELSETQTNQLEQLVSSHKESMTALKAQNFESRAEKHQAVKALHEELKTAIEGVLTEAQLTELEAFKAEMKEQAATHFHDKMNAPERKELRVAMKAYHEENILPVLLVQRAKLEEKLSEEDKAIIADLRVKMEAKRAELKEKGERRMHPRHRGTHPIAEEMETIKTLLEKYKEEMMALRDEIETERAQWKTDQQAIVQQYMPAEAKSKGHKRRGHHPPHRFHRMMKGAVKFLLLDPNADNSATEEASRMATINTLTTAPNPALNTVVVNYEIKKAGFIRIALQDEQANTIRILLNENQAVGNYNLEVNISDLKSGVYYFSLTDQDGKVVQKSLVMNQ